MRLIRLTLTAALLASAAIAPLAAQPAKRPMTFQDLMAMRRLGSTDVSPDGKWLLYTATDVDLAANTKTAQLWLQPISGGDPLKLANTQPGDDGARFSADGKQLLFLSSRDGSTQLYIAPFDPATGAAGTARQLTHLPGEADSAIWSPDSKSIAFLSQVYPDCPAITPADQLSGPKCQADRDAAHAASKVKARIFDHLLYRHWNAFTGDKRSHLFLLDVATATVRDLNPNDPRDIPPFSLEGGCGCAFSPDSKELAFTENLDEEPAISTNADIFTLDLTDLAAKPVKVSTSPGGDFSPAYSPDGKYLAWRSQARAGYESDRFRLLTYDREKRTIRELKSGWNRDRWIDEFAWATDSTAIFTASGYEGRTALELLGLDGKSHGGFYGPDVSLSLGDKNRFEWSDLHPLANSDALVAVGMSTRRPGEVFRVESSGDGFAATTREKRGGHEMDVISSGVLLYTKATPITHLNDTLLSQLDLPKMESFWFPAADGVKVQGFLIRPPAFDPAKKYPVKFLIHGGPQGAWGDSWSYRWNAELFAANGYAVVMVNPRGSTGYGQAFVDGVNGDWGGKPFSDLMLGLDAAERQFPFLDKSRECALGASYGGYMANWILGHTNRFRCIVTHDGMYNPEAAWGQTEELWFNEWEFKGQPWNYYGKPDSENPFRKWSPALSAKNFKTPTLVVHSQLDYRLDVSQGYDLFTTLQRLKVPSRMLYFPDEGHWVLKPQNSQLWYQTVNAWVDQWTK